MLSDREDELSIRRQCEILQVNRSTHYHQHQMKRFLQMKYMNYGLNFRIMAIGG